MGIYQCLICFQILCGKYVSLIWSYIWQEVRKCSSVYTSFCVQCAHNMSSLESHVCLRLPFSIARLCLLSLYIVKAFLKFGSVTVVKYSLSVFLALSVFLSLSLSQSVSLSFSLFLSLSLSLSLCFSLSLSLCLSFSLTKYTNELKCRE